ncbi:MAG: exodeoxyribonuclease VII large subunit [Polyangiales bacterium]
MSTLPLFERGGRDGDSEERVYRVGQINRMVRLVLEERWADVWIEGELSDVTHAGSGHVYFTLNDELEQAQLRCVMFRSDARRSRARLEDGARVKLRGSLTLFEPRGGFQLIARIALPQGLGELQAQVEALRRKLEAEGLLAEQRKRPLPRVPRVLGVVTSEHGAALHDIIRVASERCPLRIVVAPCLVQGNDAPRSIIEALAAIQRLPELDVVIVGRGGGAAEDLFAFNDEGVARAIAACRVPVVSAVGHEVDLTIADLVADVRAATPSNAAELCVPDRRALQSELSTGRRALERAMEVRLQRAQLRLERLGRGVRDPRGSLREHRDRLRVTRERLARAARALLRARAERLASEQERLERRDPRWLCAQDRTQLGELRQRLHAQAAALSARARSRLSEQAARLHALSPLAVLSRGYAIALHAGSGRALLRARDAAPGDELRLRLHEGELRARVRE